VSDSTSTVKSYVFFAHASSTKRIDAAQMVISPFVKVSVSRGALPRR